MSKFYISSIGPEKPSEILSNRGLEFADSIDGDLKGYTEDGVSCLDDGDEVFVYEVSLTLVKKFKFNKPEDGYFTEVKSSKGKKK